MRLNGDPYDLIRTMPAKGDRPAGPYLDGKSAGETSPPGDRSGESSCGRPGSRTDEHQLREDQAAVAYHEQLRSDRANKTTAAYVTRAYGDAPSPSTQPSLSAVINAALSLTCAGRGIRGRHRLWLPDRAAGPACRPPGQHRHLAGPGRPDAPQPDRAGHRQRRGPDRDGTGGAREFAPFDAIVVSAAYPGVPSPLAARGQGGGRLVQPIGPGGQNTSFCTRRSSTACGGCGSSRRLASFGSTAGTASPG